jgi:tetratricopeptide (TPR) repeat protein
LNASARIRIGGWSSAGARSAAGLLLLATACGPGEPPGLPAPDIAGLEPEVRELLLATGEAVVGSPDAAEAWGRLGAAYDAHGMLREATDCYRRARELAPQDFRWAYLLAIVREAQGAEADECIRLFESAAPLRPRYAPTWVRLGQALSQRGRAAEAGEAFARATALEPAAATNATGGSVSDPVRRLEVEALGASSQHEIDRALRAGAHGDYHAALRHLEAAAAVRGDDPQVLHLLGVAHSRLGEASAAAAALERALALEPEHEEARAELQRVRAGVKAKAATAGAFGSAPGPGGPQRPEFEEIARRLFSGRNWILGHAQVTDLQRALARPNLTARDEVNHRASLALELARVDDVEGAVREIERAFELAQKIPGGSADAELHGLRGLVYMRQAEVQNCVQRHNADCCIFPLRGGGVHAERGPATRARHSFEAMLSVRPEDMTARWLLNIASMALGDWPQGVDERYRLPPQAFGSDRDVGRFVDRAPELGIDAFNLCGGTIADDLDGDLLIDIVTSTHDPSGPLVFYRNDGRGGFEDRSGKSRTDDQLGGLNIIGADYDNDGDLDVLVLRGAWLFDDGRIRNSLLRNSGDGTFTDVTRRAGLDEPAYPTQAAAWGDFDNDGDLDLYVGAESSSESADPFPSQLFRNNGDGTFTNITAEAGVTNGRYTKGVTAGDFDNDGWTDIYVSNIGANRLYLNNRDGTFSDVAPGAGVVEPSGRSFAPWFFDYDNDGWLDLFVAAYDASVADLALEALGRPNRAEIPRLYRNNGDGTFSDATRRVGLDHAYLPMGANFGDLDNDGWLDIYLATGDPQYKTLMPNVMLRNEGGLRFQNVTTSGGFGHLQKGHGVAFADFDNDGDQDIYHQLGGFFPGDKFHNALFENPGHGGHWLVLMLEGVESNRAAYGARVRLVIDTPDGEREIHRAVGSVSSFGGSPRRLELGLADARGIHRVEVHWPRSGLRQSFEGVPLDSWIRIREGRPSYELLELPRLRLGGE